MKAAQASADRMAEMGELSHDFENLQALGQGENLSVRWISELDVNYTEIVDSWYLDEIDHYNFNKPGFSLATSHFTQLVWKSSTSFCMRHAFSDDGKQVYFAARYVERGNRVNKFRDNVMPLKSEVMDTEEG